MPNEAELHADVHELMGRLLPAARDGRWLDSFLLAAGAVQIVEDRLQGASWPPRRLVRHLDAAGRSGARGAALRSAGRGFAGRCLDASTEAFLAAPPMRGLQAWTTRMAGLTEDLAALALGVDADGAELDGVREGVERAAAALTRDTPGPGSGLLRGALLRPPACFCGFDQHPQDLAELARRFADRHPDRARPLLVLGVRTSGSYLAPLAGAALRQLGYRQLVVGTTRPGAALLAGGAALVRGVLGGAGMVLLLDDPPVTGGSLLTVALRAQREGFPPRSVVPLFAAFEDGWDGWAVPPALERYPCVVLPGADWHVHTRLRPDALHRTVSALLAPGRRLVGLDVGAQGTLSRDAHLAVPLTARVEDTDGGVAALPMRAEWSGVGWFGRRAVDLAAVLGGLVPTVHGFDDGVLLRERLPGEDAPSGAAGGAPSVGPADVARYVAARQRLLAVPQDRSLLLAGREPVWELAARRLAPALGRLDLALRPTLLQPLMRSLLAAREPCVVDGRTARAQWARGAAGGWVKTDFAEGAFSNRNRACYDAAYDLAGAAVDGEPADDFDTQLLHEYRKLTGRHITAARWCLYRLVQADRLGPRAAVRRAQSRAVQAFLAAVLLADLDAEPQGPWCVLDVDGVLESDVLGFSASSPQGALALRALRAHGYRTLLATGRSLPEVRDRCTAYRLPGGVAEYGALCHDTASGRTRVAVGPERRPDDDGGLRHRLVALPGVTVDPLSQWCVRASVGDGNGRTALPARTVAALLDEAPIGQRFSVVPGQAQTDFVPRGCDKAGGVRTLFALLGAADTAVPLLAVGDGVADLPLLRWAARGAAPANAAPEVLAAGVPTARRAYQAGLAEIIGKLIGHRPGGCPRCRPPEQSAEDRALLAVLALPGAGRAGAPARLLRLVAEQAALPRRTPAALLTAEPPR
jgi:hydroxymethylpyrimidine pyrophosphatase-like HAD family hydrolase